METYYRITLMAKYGKAYIHCEHINEYLSSLEEAIETARLYAALLPWRATHIRWAKVNADKRSLESGTVSL